VRGNQLCIAVKVRENCKNSRRHDNYLTSFNWYCQSIYQGKVPPLLRSDRSGGGTGRLTGIAIPVVKRVSTCPNMGRYARLYESTNESGGCWVTSAALSRSIKGGGCGRLNWCPSSNVAVITASRLGQPAACAVPHPPSRTDCYLGTVDPARRPRATSLLDVRIIAWAAIDGHQETLHSSQ
jgi:hypothetical protein